MFTLPAPMGGVQRPCDGVRTLDVAQLHCRLADAVAEASPQRLITGTRVLPDAHLNQADQDGLADTVVALEPGEPLHIKAGNDTEPGLPAVLNQEAHELPTPELRRSRRSLGR